MLHSSHTQRELSSPSCAEQHPTVMSSNRMMSTNNAMAPPTELDFAFAPMQPYMGFDAAAAMAAAAMPGVERPLLRPHSLYDSLDFAAAGFPSFQESASSLFPGAASASHQLPPPPPSMAMAMAMPMPSSLQMPLVTLPGVPTAADVYPFVGGGGGFLKREDGSLVLDGGAAAAAGGRIGLNLGRRTYFSPADVLAVDRLLTRSRLGGAGAGLGGLGMGVLGLGLAGAGGNHHHHHQPPRCQAEGCKADLSAAKHYHRRHKVCEHHAKAAAVAAGGKQQRFCQQCSRFHVLTEFDEAKRSCRKRLTEHNRRRRKPTGSHGKDSSPPPKKAETSITTSYNSDHRSKHSKHHRSANNTTAAARSAAAAAAAIVSPNGSGVSCLDMDNVQTSSAAAAAAPAPTALSLAALPPHQDKDGGAGGLDSMLIMHRVHGRRDDDQEDEDERHFMTSLVLQAQQHDGNIVHGGGGGGGEILASTSVSDQQNGGCNGFFEVDFM